MKAAVAWVGALVVAMVAVAGTAGAGEGGDAGASKTLSPYFFVENGDPEVDRIPLESTSVDATISGVIANVRVT